MGRWPLPLVVGLGWITGSFGLVLPAWAGDGSDPNAFVECRVDGRQILMRRGDCHGEVGKVLETRDSRAPRAAPSAAPPASWGGSDPEPAGGAGAMQAELAPDQAANVLGGMPLGVPLGEAAAWWTSRGGRCGGSQEVSGRRLVSCVVPFLGGPARLSLHSEEQSLTYASLEIQDVDARLRSLVAQAQGRWPDDRHMAYEVLIERLSDAMNAQFGAGSALASKAKAHGIARFVQESGMQWTAQDRSMKVEQKTTISGGATSYELSASVFATAAKAELRARSERRRDRMRAVLER